MPTPIETVTDFCQAFGAVPDGGRAAIRRWFTPATLWVNEGLTRTTGIDEAVTLTEAFEVNAGVATVTIETLEIAAVGDKVLTERIDRMFDAGGRELAAVRLMGIFEVDGDQIVAWRDYFDPSAIATLMPG